MKVVKMDSIAIPCTDLNSTKKLWNELVSDQKIKDTISSKKLIRSLPGLMSDLKKEELSAIFKTRHIHGNIDFEQFLCLVAALGDNPILKRLLLLTIYHRTTAKQ
jgi:Ca2+-binding EF-hand superfamily protein